MFNTTFNNISVIS